jgi:hypothetical protein
MPAPRRGISVPAILATVVVVGTIIAALYLLGPPSIQRERRFDGRREQDLGRLSFGVEHYWRHRHELPSTLDDLVSDHEFTRVPRDPETDAAYQYSTTGADGYKLCATFGQPSEEVERREVNPYWGRWYHGAAGQTCFELQTGQK